MKLECSWIPQSWEETNSACGIWAEKKPSSLRWDNKPSCRFNCRLVISWAKDSTEPCLYFWLRRNWETEPTSSVALSLRVGDNLLRYKNLIYFLLLATGLETKCRYSVSKCYSTSLEYFSIRFFNQVLCCFSFLWIPSIVLEKYLNISDLFRINFLAEFNVATYLCAIISCFVIFISFAPLAHQAHWVLGKKS